MGKLLKIGIFFSTRLINHIMNNQKIIIYVDMDDVLCDFIGAYNKAKREFPDVLYPQSKPSFFHNLKPIEGTIEGFLYLYSQKAFDVYILTAPSVYNPLCYTEKRLWVEDNLGFEVAHKLILASNKALFQGHYLIDDMDRGKGQEGFIGVHIHFGSQQFKTWHEIIQKFKKEFEI
jgi:5'-nucleotidase